LIGAIVIGVPKHRWDDAFGTLALADPGERSG